MKKMTTSSDHSCCDGIIHEFCHGKNSTGVEPGYAPFEIKKPDGSMAVWMLHFKMQSLQVMVS
ncbi:hypothetical protein [Psychromonas sp. MB-3u-54]|uniref:hypothetical protein n=1 Tax=Psychromonas sp. MB-3u-54 TaxID=2058319 RepID=UPI0012FF079A|nr:hypothetical protein [Psychromonas sp. MB-3u-54]